ncbi:GntR family transcriptional regulator [Chloroflexota bacterium]|nr:GntR family transcriptional regulator [Chloroflexota bacterium]
MNKIDFSSSVPYYAQLKELIKSEITDGIWRNEENLPSHSEICDLYDVSKSVVRQALRELELEGFIVQRRGKLTEILNKKISGDLLQKLSGTYQNMTRLGINPVTKVLLNEVVIAPTSVCDRLGLEPGSKAVKLHRLRFVENEPFAFMRSYVPFDLCPKIAEIDLTGKSLLEEIRREYGYEIDSSRRSIEAVLANEDEARLLEVPIGSALLLYKSVSYLKNGRGIGSTKVLFRGDRTKFEVEIGNFRD